MEMMGVVGSSMDGGSVLPPLDSGTPVERDGSLGAAGASKCSSWSCSYDISGLRSDTRVIKSTAVRRHEEFLVVTAGGS